MATMAAADLENDKDFTGLDAEKASALLEWVEAANVQKRVTKRTIKEASYEDRLYIEQRFSDFQPFEPACICRSEREEGDVYIFKRYDGAYIHQQTGKVTEDPGAAALQVSLPA